MGQGLLIFEVSRSQTISITVGRTPLDEGSARRRDLYLTIHNPHNKQTSMPLVGFKPTISAGEQPQTYDLDPTATGTSNIYIYHIHSLHGAESFFRSCFPVSQEIPCIPWIQRLITTFTSACHMSLSWANSIQTKPPQSTSWRSILKLSTNYAWVSRVVSFPQVSPPKPCIHLSYPPQVPHAPPFHSSWFYHPNNIERVQIIKFLIM